jgi:hypothetical protein
MELTRVHLWVLSKFRYPNSLVAISKLEAQLGRSPSTVGGVEQEGTHVKAVTVEDIFFVLDDATNQWREVSRPVFEETVARGYETATLEVGVGGGFESEAPEPRRQIDYHLRQIADGPSAVVEQLIQKGLLELAPLAERVSFKFKVEELRSMLKARGLPVSGTKAKLIQRLIEHAAPAMAEATRDVGPLYQCTARGLQLVEQYLAEEEVNRESAEREVLDLLAQGQYEAAVRRVNECEVTQVFPRGPLGQYDVECLHALFTSTPSILKGLDPARLVPLRLAAGMMQLSGDPRAVRRWLPADFETGAHFDAETACRMLSFSVNERLRRKSAKESGVRVVEVLGASDSCPECQAISGRHFPLDQAPELPYPLCTSVLGCRCVTLPVPEKENVRPAGARQERSSLFSRVVTWAKRLIED